MKKYIAQKIGVLMGTLLVVCLCSCGKGTVDYIAESEQASDSIYDQVETLTSEEEEEKLLFVYVCGHVKKELQLSERIYRCECGSELDRDVNAAINIREEGRRILMARESA